MIASALYREPALLDSTLHRHLKLPPLRDYSVTQGLHAVYVAATEFPQCALDFPIVFIESGERDAAGRPVISPIALLGLVAGENLHLNGAAWDARYVPAFIRRYPFLTATLPGAAAPGVLIDSAWPGLADPAGEPLFDAAGEAAPALQRALQFLQLFEAEALRTREFCERVAGLGLLKPMQADATLPDGKTLSIDGFCAIDEEKLNGLPDPLVLELHRSGVLMLLQMHLLSLSNIRHLVDRKARAASAPSPSTREAP